MADNKEGMRTYALAQKIITERNEAISQAKFWRACTIVLATAGIISNVFTYAHWMGAH